jgi:hypothetical protein
MTSSGEKIECFDETLLEFVGSGIYASVWRIVGTDTVVKTPTDIALQQHISEKRAYERLGKHASILKYYGEVEITTKFSRKKALKLQYCPAGTLLEYFSTPGPSKQEGIAQSYVHGDSKEDIDYMSSLEIDG